MLFGCPANPRNKIIHIQDMSQNNKLIVVVGATGNQGGSAICYLKSSDQNYRIRGLTRDTKSERARELQRLGVEMVQCDINNMDQLMNAFKDAYAVFAVTNFWQPDIMKEPQLEFRQGKNMVDAAVANNVQQFIWSSLDDAEKTSGRSVYHFTYKHRVEEYARTKNFPYSAYIYAGFFFENFSHNMFKLNRDRNKACVVSGVNENVRLPMFSIHDIGMMIRDVIENPEKHNKKILLGASELITMPECCEVLSRVLNIPTTYEKMDMDKVTQQMGEEMSEMLYYFNKTGFYVRDQETKFEETRRNFPKLKSFEQWLTENKDRFLKTSSA